jgi:hypothetical protein
MQKGFEMSEAVMTVPTIDGKSVSRIPMSVKVAYSAFMAVLIPYYYHSYGPSNFLWFCDVALIVTLIGMWKESKFLISTQAVAIVFPQCLWCIDFFFNMAFHRPMVGLATYMFDPNISLFVRGLSLFHGWLPFLLVWLVSRMGYDRNAWKAQIGICWAVLLTVFLTLPGPSTLAGNVDKVFGWGENAQTVMHPVAWLGIVLLAYPLLVYVPSHLVFSRVFADKSEQSSVAVEA